MLGAIGVEQVPIETTVVVPFVPLPKFAAHEEHLLAGARPHVAVERAELSELWPAIPGHLGEQRALTVHHLIVRERQHKIFGPRVKQAEGEVAMMVAAVDWLLGEIFERVVHPTHVPLEAEAETADVERTAYRGPRGGFFGDHQNAGMMCVDPLIEHPDERNSVEIFAAAIDIGNPLTGVTRVIQVEHRGNRVNANTIGMKLGEPVVRPISTERSIAMT